MVASPQHYWNDNESVTTSGMTDSAGSTNLSSVSGSPAIITGE